MLSACQTQTPSNWLLSRESLGWQGVSWRHTLFWALICTAREAISWILGSESSALRAAGSRPSAGSSARSGSSSSSTRLSVPASSLTSDSGPRRMSAGCISSEAFLPCALEAGPSRASICPAALPWSPVSALPPYVGDLPASRRSWDLGLRPWGILCQYALAVWSPLHLQAP